jgi:hypothetical protein
MTAPRSSTRGRDPVWLLAAAVLAVAAGVLIFGVDWPPQVDTVTADSPHTPSARIAWWTFTNGRDCLDVADTDGFVRELTCIDVTGGLVGWTEQGILMKEEPGLAQAIFALDPDTGERTVLERTVTPDHEPDPPAVTEREDGRLILSLDHTPPEPMAPEATRLGRIVLWDVEAPQGYDVVRTLPSPDGTAIAIHDNADRLLVMPADGSAEPLLWHTDVPPRADLSWEGTQP